MEPKGSSQYSQELSICSYPEQDQSGPHNPIPPLQHPSQQTILIFWTEREREEEEEETQFRKDRMLFSKNQDPYKEGRVCSSSRMLLLAIDVSTTAHSGYKTAQHWNPEI
jgi:hypothetical protein